MEQEPVCRRCLLNEQSAGELYQNIVEYINYLPADTKVPPVEYERRLNICKTCDNFINGMCALCGCFIEVRAVKKHMRCADKPFRW